MLRYSEPLDTVQQIRDSGMTFSPLAGTVMVWLAETDPRAVMAEIRAEQGWIWLSLRVIFAWSTGLNIY